MSTLLHHDIRNPLPTSMPQQVYSSMRESIRVGVLAALDALALLAALTCSHLIRTSLLAGWIGHPSLTLMDRLKTFPIFLLIQLLLFATFNLYRQGDHRRNLLSVTSAVSMGILILYIGGKIYAADVHGLYLWLLWGFAISFVSLGRMGVEHAIRFLRRNGMALTRTLVIGRPPNGTGELEHFRAAYEIVGYLAPTAYHSDYYLGGIERLEEVIKTFRVHEVLLSEELSRKDLLAVLNACVAQGVQLKIMLPQFRALSNPLGLHFQNGTPMLEVVQPHLGITQFALKRLFDLVSTSLGLVIISPLLLLIALAIRLDSPGPILFKQQRVSVKGRTFWMYKFRSMYVDAEAQLEKIIHLNERKDGLMFKVKNDPRITKVGRFLRKTSLDELPQLFNVLRGEMSLVGPRPPLPREVEQYATHHRQRLEVLPGITGLWQVSGRSEIVDFEEVVRLDLEYIQDWSLWLDFKILAKTLPAVIQSKGAC